jgi:hypothetical protein
MSLSIISDVDIKSVDTNALATELRSVRTQEPTPATPAKPSAPAQPNDDSGEPRRFAGKSREDIMEMYLNMEKHGGQLANRLGQTERALQELMVDKRARDLAANGDKAPTTVDPADLLQRPTEALDPFIEERVGRAISPIQQQLSRLESMLGQTVFQNHHADAQDVTNSPEFAEWVRETPLRRSIAQLAANGNTQAADELLTEFKQTKRIKAAQASNDQESRLAAASRVSLEQSRTGNDGSVGKPGKVYSRGEMLALMQTPGYQNDDKLREEVSKAYIEGRVR